MGYIFMRKSSCVQSRLENGSPEYVLKVTCLLDVKYSLEILHKIQFATARRNRWDLSLKPKRALEIMY